MVEFKPGDVVRYKATSSGEWRAGIVTRVEYMPDDEPKAKVWARWQSHKPGMWNGFETYMPFDGVSHHPDPDPLLADYTAAAMLDQLRNDM